MKRGNKSESRKPKAEMSGAFQHAEPVPRWLVRMEQRIAAGLPEPKRSRKTLLERK